jgi:hypothetical protein
MRIVITSPPRSGNHWLKCLLSRIYDLDWLRPRHQVGHRPEDVRAWAERGGFPDNTIYFQHCRYSARLCDAFDLVPARLVTIVRDPYDVFVSYYYWIQEREARQHGRQKERRRNVLIGKPLDHPRVHDFIANEFRANLSRAHEWARSGRAVVVRYEGLHRDPVAELTRATDQLAPVSPARIEAAIEACNAENMRQMKEKFTWQIRAATVGDSRQRLSEPLLAVFREQHGDLIRALGYEVR